MKSDIIVLTKPTLTMVDGCTVTAGLARDLKHSLPVTS